MSEIRLDALRREFGSTIAVDSITETFENASITCLLGPSGCGKTTLLRMVAGLERPTSGRVFFGERDVTALSPGARDIGMVFQYPVLYRGLTVFGNLELPLKEMPRGARLSPGERAQRVEEILALLGLEGVAGKPVEEVDTGTKQKVAVGRAVIRRPKIVIFDEPVTNVDPVSKLEIQRDIKRLTKLLEQTILYVTHDQTEAMTLADRIVLLEAGRVVESAAPREIYQRPRSRFGGWFLGSPGMNFVPVPSRPMPEGMMVSLPLSDGETLLPAVRRADVTAGFRAEQVVVRAAPAPGCREVRVSSKTLGIGGQWLVAFELDGHVVRARTSGRNGAEIGATAWVTCPPDAVAFFDADGSRMAA